MKKTSDLERVIKMSDKEITIGYYAVGRKGKVELIVAPYMDFYFCP